MCSSCNKTRLTTSKPTKSRNTYGTYSSSSATKPSVKITFGAKKK